MHANHPVILADSCLSAWWPVSAEESSLTRRFEYTTVTRADLTPRQISAVPNGAVDGRAARWSGQGDKRRAELVEAALQAIAHYGPQASIEQVADHVGVTRTKLYRYFDGAADLHRSVARRASDMLTARQSPTWRRRCRNSPHNYPNGCGRCGTARFTRAESGLTHTCPWGVATFLTARRGREET